MGRIKRGRYVFVTWKGDHPPYHVNVLRDGRTVLKWDLVLGRVISGRATRRLIRLIEELQSEGLL